MKLEVNGCFVFVGYDPISEAFKGQIELEERGYILTDEDMRTNIPGVFAAGDVRVKPLRQVITAAADGAAIAVNTLQKNILNQKELSSSLSYNKIN